MVNGDDGTLIMRDEMGLNKPLGRAGSIVCVIMLAIWLVTDPQS
jgi:hypothetical protein